MPKCLTAAEQAADTIQDGGCGTRAVSVIQAGVGWNGLYLFAWVSDGDMHARHQTYKENSDYPPRLK